MFAPGHGKIRWGEGVSGRDRNTGGLRRGAVTPLVPYVRKNIMKHDQVPPFHFEYITGRQKGNNQKATGTEAGTQRTREERRADKLTEWRKKTVWWVGRRTRSRQRQEVENKTWHTELWPAKKNKKRLNQKTCLVRSVYHPSMQIVGSKLKRYRPCNRSWDVTEQILAAVRSLLEAWLTAARAALN